MKLRKILIGVVLVLVGVPAALVLTAFVSIRVLDRTDGALVSSGEEREYLLHVSPSVDSARPTPLVIRLHALATLPAQQMNLSRWNQLAASMPHRCLA